MQEISIVVDATDFPSRETHSLKTNSLEVIGGKLKFAKNRTYHPCSGVGFAQQNQTSKKSTSE